MFEQTEKVLRIFEGMNVPQYDLLIYYKGKELYRRLYGFSDYERKIPTSGKELYNIYSCSKPITCAAAMSLVEDGKLSLDDAVERYLPSFRKLTVRHADGTLQPPKKRMTVLHLFSMSGGLTYDFNSENMKKGKADTDGLCPTVKMMDYLAEDPLIFEPGTHYNYSLCHDVLAAVAEVIAGEPFRDYVKKRIFDRCGMEHSTYHAADVNESDVSAQYIFMDGQYKPLGRLENGYRLGSEYDSGGAGCISTTEDYVRFLEAMRTATVLRSETVDWMCQNRLTDSALPDYPLTYCGYGYGLGLRCPMPDASVHDFGWGGAAAAYCAASIEHEYSVYYAQHVIASPNQQIRDLIIPALEADLGYTDGGKRMEELYELCRNETEKGRLY